MIEKESRMSSIKNMFILNKEKKNTVINNTLSKTCFKNIQQSKKEDSPNNNLISLIPIPRTSINFNLNTAIS